MWRTTLWPVPFKVPWKPLRLFLAASKERRIGRSRMQLSTVYNAEERRSSPKPLVFWPDEGPTALGSSRGVIWGSRPRVRRQDMRSNGKTAFRTLVFRSRNVAWSLRKDPQHGPLIELRK